MNVSIIDRKKPAGLPFNFSFAYFSENILARSGENDHERTKILLTLPFVEIIEKNKTGVPSALIAGDIG